MNRDTKHPLALLTFDVEESFHIEAARAHVDRATWHDQPSRLAASVDWLLESLHRADAIATFFTLGWVARKHPQLVARIAAAGHEIACHGHMHDRLHRLTPESFRADLQDARAALQQAAGVNVHGYRAPTFSITRATAWAVDVLLDEGFTYDSSVQPTRHPQYGVADAPRWPYRLISSTGHSIAEIPPLTWQIGPLRMPVAGGGYFRLLPLSMMLGGIRQAHRRHLPAMLYFHPWEFDPDQPRLPLDAVGRFRTYVGLRHSRRRLVSLLKQVRSSRVDAWLAAQHTSAWPEFSLDVSPHPHRRAA